MPHQLHDKLVIAISSRALFNLDDSHKVYEQEGLQAYSDYQIAREEEPLEPGEAFPLVHKLLRLNDRLGPESGVEVVLLSRNSADTGLRVFNSRTTPEKGLPLRWAPDESMGIQRFPSPHSSQEWVGR